MQRVLLERNQYKQRLFELEEAIHWRDALRASKQEQSIMGEGSFDPSHNKKQTTFWKLCVFISKMDFYLLTFSCRFSGLFGSGVKDAPLPPPPPPPRRSATTSFTPTGVKKSPTNDQIAPINSKKENPAEPLDQSDANRFDFILS